MHTCPVIRRLDFFFFDRRTSAELTCGGAKSSSGRDRNPFDRNFQRAPVSISGGILERKRIAALPLADVPSPPQQPMSDPTSLPL